jgi:hypothetical protein
MPGLDPGIHLKATKPGESPAFLLAECLAKVPNNENR